MKAIINGKVRSYPTTLQEIEFLYNQLNDGDQIIIKDNNDMIVERHTRVGGEIITKEEVN